MGENESTILLNDGPDIENTLNSTASLNIDILLLGETGTGKDTLAQRVHRLSGRRGNFVAVNCAAIPESLAESQLFGVNSGAYTGGNAITGRICRSRPSEVPCTSTKSTACHCACKPNCYGCWSRVGWSAWAQPVLYRWTCASSRPHSIRFIRWSSTALSGVTCTSPECRQHPAPPLRDRRERIIPLFLEMIQQEAAQFKCNAPPPPGGLLQQLLCHPWLGNVRELRSTAKRFVLGLPPLSTSSSRFAG